MQLCLRNAKLTFSCLFKHKTQIRQKRECKGLKICQTCCWDGNAILFGMILAKTGSKPNRMLITSCIFFPIHFVIDFFLPLKFSTCSFFNNCLLFRVWNLPRSLAEFFDIFLQSRDTVCGGFKTFSCQFSIQRSTSLL